MFAAVKANAGNEDRQLMATISVDSTSVRARVSYARRANASGVRAMAGAIRA